MKFPILRWVLGSALFLAFANSAIVFALAAPTTEPTATEMTAPTMEEPAPPEMPAGPTLSNVTVTDITDTSARIDINSDEVVQGYVEYGTTEQYGMSTPLTSEFSTSPSFLLENLSPQTLYHYRVIAMDSAGNATITSDATFTTLATPAPEPEPTPEPSPTTKSTATTTTAAPTATTTKATATSTPTSTATTTPTVTKTPSTPPPAPLVITKASPPPVAIVYSQGGGGLPSIPLPPALLNVVPLDGRVLFKWKKDRGGVNGIIHTVIVKKEGTSPVRSRIDGEIIYDGPDTTFTDTDVVNGTEYHYGLYSYGKYGRFTRPAQFKVIPQASKKRVAVPAAPAAKIAEENTPALTFARDLSQGRRGDDVRALQKHLAENGYYPEALITGYFGMLTRKAIIRYQVLNGIVPPIGYVGPLTREALER